MFNCGGLTLFRREDEQDFALSQVRQTNIPSKLNGTLEKLLPAAPSIYAEVATNAAERSHNLWVRYPFGGWRMVMLRKTVLALLAAVTVTAAGLATTTDASARGGFGGGGFRGGGGFHGGFGGGGFRGGGFRGGGFRGPAFGAIGVGLGLGLAGAYAGYGYPYGYGYGYDPYYAGYYDNGGYGYGGGCYVVRQRIWTGYGWAFRPVQVCN
jgi:hypothetical protein